MESKKPKEPLATRKDAALFYAVSERTIDRLRQAGKLKAIKVGKAVRFSWKDLQSIDYQTINN